jgi:hypothetical protein
VDHKSSVLSLKDLNSKVLQTRLKDLRWTTYRLAQEVAKMRSELYGEEIKNPKGLVNGVKSCLEDPDRSSGKMLNCVVKAMGGSINVKWTTEKVIVTTEEQEEVL